MVTRLVVLVLLCAACAPASRDGTGPAPDAPDVDDTGTTDGDDSGTSSSDDSGPPPSDDSGTVPTDDSGRRDTGTDTAPVDTGTDTAPVDTAPVDTGVSVDTGTDTGPFDTGRAPTDTSAGDTGDAPETGATGTVVAPADTGASDSTADTAPVDSGGPDTAVVDTGGAGADTSSDTAADTADTGVDPGPAFWSISVADATLLGSNRGDNLGSSVLLEDMDGDGLADVSAGARYADPGGWSAAGAAYTFRSPVSGSVDVSTADAIVDGGGTSDNAGAELDAGDLDGDGVMDLVVVAKDSGDMGYVSVMAGTLAGTYDASTDALTKVIGDAWIDGVGLHGAVGDLDGNGVDDLIVGSEMGAGRYGEVGVFYGPLSSPYARVSDGDLVMDGEAYEDWAGGAVAAGDLDGDGVDDLIVVATGADAGGAQSGSIYVLLGNGGAADLASADATYVGETANASTGGAPVIADVTGDGAPDLVVLGSGTPTTCGTVYAISWRAGTTSMADADARMVGDPGDWLGNDIAAGDFDGDGATDVAASARFYDSRRGGVLVTWGPLSGTFEPDAVVEGDAAGDEIGVSLDAGDVDGDGLDDLLVGADYADGSVSESGAAYLLLRGSF